jgi:hypothetical protein
MQQSVETAGGPPQLVHLDAVVAGIRGACLRGIATVSRGRVAAQFTR